MPLERPVVQGNLARKGIVAKPSLMGFDMITAAAAKLMNLKGYGLAVGNPADLLVLPCRSPAAAVTELCPPSMGFKAGRRSFSRPPAQLMRP